MQSGSRASALQSVRLTGAMPYQGVNREKLLKSKAEAELPQCSGGVPAALECAGSASAFSGGAMPRRGRRKQSCRNAKRKQSFRTPKRYPGSPDFREKIFRRVLTTAASALAGRNASANVLPRLIAIQTVAATAASQTSAFCGEARGQP